MPPPGEGPEQADPSCRKPRKPAGLAARRRLAIGVLRVLGRKGEASPFASLSWALWSCLLLAD